MASLIAQKLAALRSQRNLGRISDEEFKNGVRAAMLEAIQAARVEVSTGAVSQTLYFQKLREVCSNPDELAGLFVDGGYSTPTDRKGTAEKIRAGFAAYDAAVAAEKQKALAAAAAAAPPLAPPAAGGSLPPV